MRSLQFFSFSLLDLPDLLLTIVVLFFSQGFCRGSWCSTGSCTWFSLGLDLHLRPDENLWQARRRVLHACGNGQSFLLDFGILEQVILEARSDFGRRLIQRSRSLDGLSRRLLLLRLAVNIEVLFWTLCRCLAALGGLWLDFIVFSLNSHGRLSLEMGNLGRLFN